MRQGGVRDLVVLGFSLPRLCLVIAHHRVGALISAGHPRCPLHCSIRGSDWVQFTGESLSCMFEMQGAKNKMSAFPISQVSEKTLTEPRQGVEAPGGEMI